MVGRQSCIGEYDKVMFNSSLRDDFFKFLVANYPQTPMVKNQFQRAERPCNSTTYFGPWPNREHINPLSIPLAPMWAWNKSINKHWSVSKCLTDISQFSHSEMPNAERALDDECKLTQKATLNQREPNRRKQKSLPRKLEENVKTSDSQQCNTKFHEHLPLETELGQHCGEGDPQSLKNQQEMKEQLNLKLIQDNNFNELTGIPEISPSLGRIHNDD